MSKYVGNSPNQANQMANDYAPPPPRPQGKKGHLDLLWLPVIQMCVGVRVRLCRTLFMQYIFPSVFHQYNDFQIFRYGDHGQNLELINFS